MFRFYCVRESLISVSSHHYKNSLSLLKKEKELWIASEHNLLYWQDASRADFIFHYCVSTKEWLLGNPSMIHIAKWQSQVYTQTVVWPYLPSPLVPAAEPSRWPKELTLPLEMWAIPLPSPRWCPGPVGLVGPTSGSAGPKLESRHWLHPQDPQYPQHTRTSIRLPACLPARLPASLLVCLPFCLPPSMPVCLAQVLPSPNCLPSYTYADLHVCLLHMTVPFRIPAFLRPYLLACLRFRLYSLPAYQPDFLYPFPFSMHVDLFAFMPFCLSLVLYRTLVAIDITSAWRTWSQSTTAQRCRSETEAFILEDLLSSVLSQFKEYHPSGILKLNNLGIFQSCLKMRILVEKNTSNIT